MMFDTFAARGQQIYVVRCEANRAAALGSHRRARSASTEN